jgi:hypothetical protein
VKAPAFMAGGGTYVIARAPEARNWKMLPASEKTIRFFVPEPRRGGTDILRTALVFNFGDFGNSGDFGNFYKFRRFWQLVL